MKPILCALDFSESSLEVMKVAFEIGTRFDSPVTGLFSYRLIQLPDVAIAEYRKSTEARALQDFCALIRKLNINESVKYEFRSEIGFLSDRLEVYGQQNKIGLIVMSQEMAGSIHEHKNLSLQDFVKALKIPLFIVPKEVI